MNSFTLPWPHKDLSPNGRPHHFAKARQVKAARALAHKEALAAKIRRGDARRRVEVTFCPKTKGPVPDQDNCIASFKAYQDGLADAMGCDDRELIVSHAIGHRFEGGQVIVTLLSDEDTPDDLQPGRAA